MLTLNIFHSLEVLILAHALSLLYANSAPEVSLPFAVRGLTAYDLCEKKKIAL